MTFYYYITYIGEFGVYGPLGNMGRWGIWTTLIKIENIFCKCRTIQTKNGIKIMLFSPFYGFKNNFQKQTNDKGPFDVKIGGPCKNTR